MKMILQQLQQAKKAPSKISAKPSPDLAKKIKAAEVAYDKACNILEKITGIKLKNQK